MATTVIPGRNGTATLVSDTFSPYGEAPKAPEPVDDPSGWHPRRLSEKDVLARLRMSADELNNISGEGPLAFPRPSRNTLTTSRGSWHVSRVREWDESAIVSWEDRIRSLATRLPKK